MTTPDTLTFRPATAGDQADLVELNREAFLITRADAEKWITGKDMRVVVRNGEVAAGAIGSPPAVINAIVDALRDYGVTHIDMPATPAKIWNIVNQGATAQAAE